LRFSCNPRNPIYFVPCVQVPRHIVGDLIDTLLISRQEEVA
jgi:hypothetical protein